MVPRTPSTIICLISGGAPPPVSDNHHHFYSLVEPMIIKEQNLYWSQALEAPLHFISEPMTTHHKLHKVTALTAVSSRMTRYVAVSFGWPPRSPPAAASSPPLSLFLGAESRRRRFRELAGGPVGAAAEGLAATVPIRSASSLSAQDTHTQTELKFCV